MKKIRVIIATLPGTWQQLLMNNLDSDPRVNVIAVAHGSLTAVQLVKEHHPDMILIDSTIPIDDSVAMIQNIRLESPGLVSIVIGDTSFHRQRAIQAGADFALSTYKFPYQIHEILNNIFKDANPKPEEKTDPS